MTTTTAKIPSDMTDSELIDYVRHAYDPDGSIGPDDNPETVDINVGGNVDYSEYDMTVDDWQRYIRLIRDR